MTYKKKDKSKRRKIKVRNSLPTLFIQPWSENEI